MGLYFKTKKDITFQLRLPVALVIIALLAYLLFVLLSADRRYRRTLIPPQPANTIEVVDRSRPSALSSEKPYCSFDVFRRLLLRRGSGSYLSGCGTWKGLTANPEFQPSICRLKYGISIPSEEVVNCLRRKKIKNILLLGDSNGLQYFNWLFWHLNRLEGVNCRSGLENNLVTWNTYDLQNMDVVRRCRCGRSGSIGRCAIGYKPVERRDHTIAQVSPRYRQQRCDFRGGGSDGPFSVVLEYTYVQYQFDYQVQGEHWGCQERPDGAVIPATGMTEGEFLLDEFYSDPRPDLILYFDNAHDGMLLEELDRHMIQVSKLIERFVKPPTKLVWMNRVGEYVERKPTYWRKMRYQNGTMSRIQWLEAANRIAFDTLREVLLNTTKLVLFPDMLSMSKPVLRKYSGDGVHMKPAWYQLVISYILQALCMET